MDWKMFFVTFMTIFLAEIGDKTQFAAIAVSSQTKSVGTVLLAVVLALSFAGVLGVLGGHILGEFIRPELMKWISGSLFIVIGLWTLLA